VAGQRWCIEESFQAPRDLIGLDQHQVRRWTSWHRWTTLAMLAHAFVAATATERDHNAAATDLITLTVNEFRRLVDALILDAQHTNQPPALVPMAPTTRTPSPPMPLPTPPKPMITNYGCSTTPACQARSAACWELSSEGSLLLGSCHRDAPGPDHDAQLRLSPGGQQCLSHSALIITLHTVKTPASS
jgi:hypothetical protein